MSMFCGTMFVEEVSDVIPESVSGKQVIKLYKLGFFAALRMAVLWVIVREGRSGSPLRSEYKIYRLMSDI